MKFNPDTHYSCSLYKVLGKNSALKIQANKIVLNRDDQAGFRLDTTYTHSKHRMLSVDQEVTTRTDFVNKYSSVLQSSTYLFMARDKPDERAAELSKIMLRKKKNASQHAADFKFLKTTEEFKHLFLGKSVDEGIG